MERRTEKEEKGGQDKRERRTEGGSSEGGEKERCSSCSLVRMYWGLED